MDKAVLARLAFWGMNITAATGGKNNWPGFGYDAADWERLSKLSDAVEAGRFGSIFSSAPRYSSRSPPSPFSDCSCRS